MAKSNCGLRPLLWTFGIFFVVAIAAILIQERWFPRDNTVRYFVLDCPFENTQTREWQSAEREYNERQAREAKDRVDNGTASDRDREIAIEHELNGWS